MDSTAREVEPGERVEDAVRCAVDSTRDAHHRQVRRGVLFFLCGVALLLFSLVGLLSGQIDLSRWRVDLGGGAVSVPSLPTVEVPGPLVLRLPTLLVQSIEQRTLPSGERRHLLEDDLEQLLVVATLDKSKVLARPLLELGVEDVSVPVEDDDKLVLDLREEVGPVV